MRAAALLLVLLLPILAGCAGPAPSAPADTAEARSVVDAIQYTCGESAFAIDILAAPGTAETGTDDVSLALRAALRPGGLPDSGIELPAAGWHRIGQNNSDAEFLNFRDGRPVYIRFHRTAGGGWDVTGLGDCQPEIVLPDGLGVATWVVDPAAPAPGPESTSFTALVTERACASGRPADDRIVGPRVLPLEDRVLVVFAVRQDGGAHTCQGNPSTRVTVELGEPLGDRELADPGVLFSGE